MNPIIATFVCACGVAGLFYLDRDKTVRTSRALWIPVLWVMIVSSRSVSEWFGLLPKYAAGSESDGLDAVIYGLLTLLAIGVIAKRRKRVETLLFANWAILLYFFFCLISVSWSSDPGTSLKRWIKAIGDLAMVLVILTDRRPALALERLIARVGYVLLPASVLLIKYYGQFGHDYTPDGIQMNTGVSTNKNMLGVMLLVVSLYTLWRWIGIWRAKDRPDRRRRLIAQGVLLLFGLLLFRLANSVTSLACFALGGSFVLATNHHWFKARPVRIHLLAMGLLLAGGLAILIGAQGSLIHAVGRQSNLSGRTEIWAAAIKAAPNPLIGAGYEDFWISPYAKNFSAQLVGWWHPEGLNEAHNGYIEVYLNLGCVGVGLIALILVTGYRRAVKAFRRNTRIGGLFLSYIIVAAVYSFSEAGFRMLDAIWIFLLLSVAGSSGVLIGIFNDKARGTTGARVSKTNKIPLNKVPDPLPQPVYAGPGGAGLMASRPKQFATTRSGANGTEFVQGSISE